MALTINTNISSLFAANILNKANKSLQINQQHLASGKRINSAAEDPSGYVIAAKFSSQIAGIEAALKNVENGSNLVDTATKSLGSVTGLLTKMKSLVLSSKDDSQSSAQRTANNQELQEIVKSIDRVAKNTKYGSVQLLDGSFTNKVFQVGESAGETYTMSIANVDSASLSIDSLDITTSAGAGTALTAVESALDTVAAESGRLGAIKTNSFDTIMSVLETQRTNLSSAKETIEGVDYTSESSLAQQNQVKIQIATQALAMANQNSALVLSLLK